MTKATTKKRPRTADPAFLDFKKGKPYDGSLYFDPDFRTAKMEMPFGRKRSKIVITTLTFIEMPDGSLTVKTSRETKPVKKGSHPRLSAGIDPAYIRMSTDGAGLLHFAERRRSAGERARPTKARTARRRAIGRA